jgi:lysophospholipase L1-like esterase
MIRAFGRDIVFSLIFAFIFTSNLPHASKTLLIYSKGDTDSTFSKETGPQQDWANLKKYAADNKRVKSMLTEEKRIVFMGNSITELWITTDSSFFANKPYINRGISGQTTPQMLVRFREDVIELEPELVIILAGVNDIAENTGPASLENICGNIISMAELARANQIRVILCSVLPVSKITWRPDLKPADKVVKLNAMIKSFADKNNIFYLDYYSSMVDEEKGLKAEYTYDGVHPSLAGFKAMEPLVEKAIAEALKK